MPPKISLLTMSQGNPVALRRTLESFKNIVDEVIYGDLLIFNDDRAIIETYYKEFNVTPVTFGFDFIFKNGFSKCLNYLAGHTSNEICLYMNCSEVVDGEERILRLLKEQKWAEEFNMFPFNHATDTHTWYRMYRKSELEWKGIIHEELRTKEEYQGRPCPWYIFQMADTPKDTHDRFKMRVFDDVKEIVYFQQYVNLVERPDLSPTTNDFWKDHARSDYGGPKGFKQRLSDKGKRYEAFLESDLHKYLSSAYSDKNFMEGERKSSSIIELQEDPMYLGKFKSPLDK